jgi:DNA-binding beta-propeller fold protein YncE
LFLAALAVLPAAPGIAECGGDCDADGSVSVAELVTGVRIALEQSPVDTCRSFDRDNDTRVTVAELTSAIKSALGKCLPALSYRLYVSHERGVSLVDTTRLEIADELDIGDSGGLAFAKTTGRLYVGSHDATRLPEISVFETETHTRLRSVPVQGLTARITLLADEAIALASHLRFCPTTTNCVGANALSTIDLQTLTLDSVSFPEFAGPSLIEVDPDDGIAILLTGGRALARFDISLQRVTGELPLGCCVTSIKFDPERRFLLVTLGGDLEPNTGFLALLDPQEGRIVEEIDLGGDFAPGDVALMDDTAYVSGARFTGQTFEGGIAVIDLQQRSVTRKLWIGQGTGGGRIALDGDSTKAFVLSTQSSNVTVVTLSDGELVATIPLPGRSYDVVGPRE